MAGHRNSGKNDEKKDPNANGANDTNPAQDPVLTSIFSKLNLLTKEANDRAEATKLMLQNISEKFDKFTEGVSNTKREIGQLKQEVINEKRESRRHDTKLSALELKLELAERDARRSNIVLEGVAERKDQSLIDILQNLLDDLQVNLRTSECDKIYRRGKKQVTKDGSPPPPRPIVIVFVRLCYKIEVFKNLKNLAGIARWNNIYLNDDFTFMQKIQIGELRAISALAKSKGMDSKVRGNSLFVDGRRYGYGDVSRLPEGLSIAEAKTISVDGGKGIGFQSKHSVFSNMSECHIVYDGYDFDSAEEVYQYRKVKECGSREDVQRVLVAEDAHKAKQVGGSVKETTNWHRKKAQVMKEVIELKLEADSGLKEKLIESGSKDLYELTYDRFWGCGFPPSKSEQVKQKGNPGSNRLGKLLMEIRATLINK